MHRNASTAKAEEVVTFAIISAWMVSLKILHNVLGKQVLETDDLVAYLYTKLFKINATL